MEPLPCRHLPAVDVPAHDGTLVLERMRWSDGQITWRWHARRPDGHVQLSFIDSVDIWETLQLALELRDSTLSLFASCGGDLGMRATGSDPALPDQLQLQLRGADGQRVDLSLDPDALCVLIDVGLRDHQALAS